MSEVPVNVCVAVRVRPLLPNERLHSHQVCVKKVPNSKNQLLVGKDKAFTFDHLLWWNTTQHDVYKTTVKPLVDTCFQGYNATVFAYGQTGSGKTFTIGGTDLSNVMTDEQGIIPRAVNDLFTEMHSPSRKHIDHVIKVSYVEIYKEEVRDLLEVDIQKSKDVHIREDKNGNTVIVGAREELCATADEVLSLLQKGSAVRHTGATQMNELSSRSHAIFTIHMIQAWECTPRPKNSNSNNNVNQNSEETIEAEENPEQKLQNVMSAKFHFVDLAGSERANRTGNTGERLKESVQINTGLLALGNVISALGDPKKKKPAHIPYRDSKITRVLKDSLGGNARTVMITCISPSSADFDETLNALKYANRAKNITNKPVVNKDPQQILIEDLQDEIEILKQQLQDRPTTREVAIQRQKRLENMVDELQQHCRLYKKHIDDATKHFKAVSAGKPVTKAHSVNIKKWLESVSKNGLDVSVANLTMSLSRGDQIQHELEQCRKNLQGDDAAFAAKDAQLDEMRQALDELEEDARDKQEALQLLEDIREHQAGKLIEQKVMIEQLQEEILFMQEGFQHLQDPSSPVNRRPPGMVSVGRAQSVPHPPRGLAFSGDVRTMTEDAQRAHSSPPLISAERIMAGFRARNHVIADRIEEEDEVDHRSFVVDGDDLDNDHQGQSEPGDRSDRSTSSRKKERSFLSEQQQWRIPSARKIAQEAQEKGPVETELNVLRESTLLSVRKLKDSELRAQNANNKIRELSINIRMKEELIKDLVRTGNDAEAVNRDYLTRILVLEREVQAAKRELLDAHKSLQMQQANGTDQEQQKLKTDYEQKLKDAKAKVQLLQKKQRETERIGTITTQNKKKVTELEIGIAAMRQMQEDLQKKLKNEEGKKRKLESELSKDQARIKELETKNKNQEKILKRKTEEVVAIQKKLRSAKNAPREEADNLDEQRRWLDEEVERALEQQNLLKQLEEALRARENSVKRREEALKRKTALETKKMRSSQVISSEALQLASKMASVDRELSAQTQQLRDSMTFDRGHQGSKHQQLKKAVERLQTEKHQLEEKRKRLEEKLQDGDVLNHQDERELIELDEAVEALTAAIEWQDDTIMRASTSADLRESRLKMKRERASGLQKHVKDLSATEAGLLLTKCFERVVELRECEQSLESRVAEMESKLSDRDRAVLEAEAALNRFAVESDRRQMEMEKEHEQRTQQLIKQLADRESSPQSSTSIQEIVELQSKISSLEKDLAHYKSTNRELKRKLREFVQEAAGGENLPLSARSNKSNSDTEPARTNSGKGKLDATSPDSAAVLTSNSTSSSVLGPINNSKSRQSGPPQSPGHGQSSNKSLDGSKLGDEKQRYASPHKPKRNLARQGSAEPTPSKDRSQAPDALPLTPTKMGSNPSLVGSANLRRSRHDSLTSHPYPSISSNSVEYLEVQDLNQNLPPNTRGNSGGRRQISPGAPSEGPISLSHPLSNPPTSQNLITASLNMNDCVGSKMYPNIHPMPTFGEEGDSPSKPLKMDPNVTSVRISKKDLKRIAKNELSQRKSSLSNMPDHSNGGRQSLGVTSNSQVGLVQDSLENFRNPW